MTRNNSKQKILEQICSQGCTVVHKVISDLKSGKPIPTMRSLTAHQQHDILRELNTIMAVYAKKT